MLNAPAVAEASAVAKAMAGRDGPSGKASVFVKASTRQSVFVSLPPSPGYGATSRRDRGIQDQSLGSSPKLVLVMPRDTKAESGSQEPESRIQNGAGCSPNIGNTFGSEHRKTKRFLRLFNDPIKANLRIGAI
jgi:hypothetical protein